MKRTALLLTMVMVLVMIFALSGCSIDATLTQGTFVEGTFVEDLLVKTYTINFVVKGETTSVTCKQGLVPTAPAVEDYETDSKSYTFLGWDKEIVAATGDATYTAIFSGSTKLYDVVFAYGVDSSEFLKLHWGADPTSKAPTKNLDYQTDDKVYTFTGWDKEIVPVNGNVVYTAQYEESVREYEVTFVYGDPADPVTESVKVAYGTLPTAPAEVAGYQTNENVYTFKGWDKEIVAVTGDATYTATYDATAREYTVTFIYDGKTETATYKYGDTVVLPTPAGYSDADGSYSFKAWDKEAAAVTGDATYTATYDAIAREYTVTFIYDGKTETATFKYGDTVILPTPAGYSDAAGSYTFKGWDKEPATVTGDATYTAEYVATSKVLYSQDFNDADIDGVAGDADFKPALGIWTLTLYKGGNYAKAIAYSDNSADKYLELGQIAGHTKDITAQLNAKGSGLAAMGDFTKLTVSIDLAAKDGVAVTKSYFRTRSTANKYIYLFHTFNNGTIWFNKTAIDGVTINTTMQTFTFEFDFAAGTATLLVDGVEKYTGAIADTPADLGTTTYAEYIAKCTAYMFNWAVEKQGDVENALIMDNLTIVAHN